MVLELIHTLFAGEPIVNEFDLGNSLHGSGDRLRVDPRVLHDNCLIVGSEGCGKTTFSARTLESLAEHGTSVVAIDTTGDLADSISRRLGLSLVRGVGRSTPKDRFRVASIDLSMADNLFSKPKSDSDELRQEENRNLISALLVVLGYRPRKFSPEFALLEQIAERRQREGLDVSLSELPQLIRNPTFSMIGVFPLDSAVPKERRDRLAAAVDSLLETPSFKYSSADPGIDLAGFLSRDGEARCNVLTFADRSVRIRQFLVAVLGSKLRTLLFSADNSPFIVWIDEAADFIPSSGQTPVSRLLFGALENWERYNASFVLVAQQLSELEADVDDFCDTIIVGQTFAASARHRLVDALDLVNPPVDEDKLNRDIKSLEPGQFILRSHWLDTLKLFETRE